MLSNKEKEYNMLLKKFQDINFFLEQAQEIDYIYNFINEDSFKDDYEIYVDFNREVSKYITNLEKIHLRDTIVERVPITEDYDEQNESLDEEKSDLEDFEEIDPEMTRFNILETDLFNINPSQDNIETVYRKIMKIVNDTFETLQRLSAEVDEEYDKLIDSEPERHLIKEIHAPTSILSDYRQASWGMERIGLDGFQNHIPSDSKGTKCMLQFLVDNKWVDRDEAKKNRDKIQKIRFVDNGVGFSYENLYLLHSTKSSEDNSVGQFGEGMKLMANAATTMGLGLELQSRNWTAIPVHETQNFTNTRKGDKKEKHKRLSFDIKLYDGEPIIGSRTIFHTPTPEFIDFSLNLPEKIMQLGEIKTLYSNNDLNMEILDIEGKGKIFVKGIYLCDCDTLFSYNFNDAEVNPDRNNFADYDFLPQKINNMIRLVDDKETIKRIIKYAIIYKKDYDTVRSVEAELCEKGKWEEARRLKFPQRYCEFNSFDRELAKKFYYFNDPERDELWQEAFIDACKELEIIDPNDENAKVALASSFDTPENLKHILKDYTFVDMPGNIAVVLEQLGIPTDKTLLPPYTEEIIKTSIPINYGEELWNEQMIVTDAAQNHLPEDSGGEHIFLRFKDCYGNWHDYREFKNYPNSKITAIKICDDGIGYDKNLLGIFASSKGKSNSSGKWGEGLKMICAAALRKRSRRRN